MGSMSKVEPTEGSYPFELKDETTMNSDAKEDLTTPLPKDRTLMTRILHSFKQKEQPAQTPGLDPEFGIPQAGDTSKLRRELKGRHLQMISIGGAIGAGLFIGSGKALAIGGPGAVVLDFILVGVMLFCTINALGELATLFPVQGISLSFKV
jgi:amino acid permease